MKLTKYAIIRYPDTAISYIKNDGEGWEHIYDRSYGFRGKVDKKDLKHMSPIEKENMPKRMCNKTEITLNVSDLELNVLQIAILHMIELCSDETEQEQDEVWAERLTAAENLRLALNTQINILNGQ